ncbi:TPA: hypothetical protein QHZ54_002543 [Proteus mirabilis]|nr:hypothetical protein [Proteus mirabilis]
MTTHQETLAALIDALEWIDAVPSDVPLPSMPGFDRDSVNELVERARQEIKQGVEVTFYLPGIYQTSCEEGEKYLCPQEVEEAIMTAGSNVGQQCRASWTEILGGKCR